MIFKFQREEITYRLIYYFDELNKINEQNYYFFEKYCSAERIKSSERYIFLNDRIQSILVYILLRISLMEIYQIYGVPLLEKDKNKKPYLKEYPSIHFNLSHCKKAVACIVSSKQVGIDVQDITAYDMDSAKIFMTSSEFDKTSSKCSDVEYTLIWSRKESYGKYMGVGICYEMDKWSVLNVQDNVDYFIQSYIFNEYIISATATEKVKLRKIGFEELVHLCKKLNRT